MAISVKRSYSCDRTNILNRILPSAWVEVLETQPTINGKIFSKELPARSGCMLRDAVDRNWFRFEIAPGDNCDAIDGPNSGKERCELRGSDRVPFNTDWRIRYEIKIYTPGAKDPLSVGWVIIGQLHQTSDAGDALASPMYSREIYAAPRAISHNRHTSQVDPLLANPAHDFVYVDPNPSAAWNRWITIVEHHRVDPTGGTGYHRVWMDGTQVMDFSGNTGYVDAVGPYYKFGIYREADAINTVVVEYKGFQVI